MTTPAPETLEREKDKLYLLDSELVRRLGVHPKPNSGLGPQEDELTYRLRHVRIILAAHTLTAPAALG